MKTEQILDELKRAAKQLGCEVRSEKGNFRGGWCKVGEEEIIMLNKRHLPRVQLTILADSLRDLPVDDIFLKPAVRSSLEEAWRRDESSEVEGAHDTE